MTALPRGTTAPQAQPGPVAGLLDNHGRRIDYLRLAITDRCNLRCRYCRPEEGVPFIPHPEILRFEELERLVRIFTTLGISKVRVTGGEPFSRRGCLDFLRRLKRIDRLQSLHVTTNGVKTARYLDELKEIGVAGINLSLDTLDPKRFWQITRRDYLAAVLETLYGALARNIPLKVNSVVLQDTSDQEILSLATLAEKHPITLRFIERMPFSGMTRVEEIINGDLSSRLQRIFPTITEEIQTITPTTARIFSIPGFKGKLGLIQGYSRLFCQRCNKVRITPAGMLKTCLYDDGALDLREFVRSGKTACEIGKEISKCINNRFVNGLAAEKACRREEEPSMSLIGG
ncbi:MAG: GTP 3',8-cyclase MoaA [Proteobacteria bacterium]|nr:GTP 3',8-cyclase MoaA [Pseudomonadota bacterium]MBU1717230.1 GTP 3',8-cyclase MoaA [Pseudomonadota bacterium]